MKKKILAAGFTSLACVVMLCGCGDDFTPGGSRNTGSIMPLLDLDAKPVSSLSESRSGEAVTADDLKVRLSSADGTYSNEWTSVAEFPTDRQFKVGDYHFEAYYGNIEEEGFEKPYYYGDQNIKVTDGGTTKVSVTAALANSMVSVTYTEAFTKYMTAYSAELHSDGGAYIYYGADETRPAYLRSGNVSVNVTVTKPNGKSATLQAAKFTAKARYHHHVTVDLNNGEVGDVVMIISFDDNTDRQPVEIDLSDEVFNAPAPEVTTEGFNGDEGLTFAPGMSPDGNVALSVIARGGIASMKMTTKSATLVSQGWPEEVDLAAAPENLRSRMEALGIVAKGLWKNPDQMAVVNLNKVLANMNYVDGGDNTSTFTFVVTDRYNKTSEPVTLTVNVEPLELSVSNAGILYTGANELEFDLGYNGADLEKQVSVEIKNERGTWSKTPILSSEPIVRSGEKYRVKVSVPAGDEAVELRAKCGKLETPSLIVERREVDYTVSAADENVFAAYAYVTLDGADVAGASMMVSTDGVKYAAAQSEVVNGLVKVTGLTPATHYYVRAAINGTQCKPCEFTTETSIQLPDGDLETWYRVSGTSKNWWIDYPGADENAVWGTMNLLTTSQGGSSGAPGAAYSAFSGTRPVDNAHNGKGAVISTVGWGDGNTAWRDKIADGTIFGVPNGGKCEHLTVGELYLGKYNPQTEQPDYTGIDFASRPSAMTFYYKYTVRNQADWGVAEIRIFAADGTEIASGAKQLGAVNEYTPVSIDLTYAPAAKKAATVKVMFKSSGNPACQSINNDNLSSPPSSNLSDGRYTGSELYIDDIVLNY